MDLIVLGASGSYEGLRGPCSGYLVRTETKNIWMDCGSGTFGNLQRHIDPEDLDAVVITHEHPDHCVDIYGLHVLLRYGREHEGLPLYAPEGAETHLGALVYDWGPTFDWRPMHDHGEAKLDDVHLSFRRTDHPPPTYAVEVRADDRRLVYTADTGPGWEVGAFEPGADLVLSEASYLHAHRKSPIHISAHQAGTAARAADAQRLLLTHLWPEVDEAAIAEEGSEAFGQAVTVARPHLITPV